MLNNEYPPFGGGTATANEHVLRELSNFPEFKITLVSAKDGKTMDRCHLADNIELIRVPVPKKNIHHASNSELLVYFFRATRVAMKLHRDECFDSCLAWCTVPAGTIAYFLYVIFKLPYIVRVSGPDIPGFEDRYRLVTSLLRPLLKRIWSRSQIVIAKCDEERDALLPFVSPDHIRIIPNGAQRPAQPATYTRDIQATPCTFLCVGRLIERKGQRYLIEAAKTLSTHHIPFQILLVGEGDSRMDYEQYAREIGVFEFITFVGSVSRDEMRNYYESSDVFVLPSQNEGMSLALLEAASFGLPLISTRTGGASEIIEEGVSGFLIEKGNVVALTEAMTRFLENDSLRKSMRGKSLARLENFQWDTIALQYAEVLEISVR